MKNNFLFLFIFLANFNPTITSDNPSFLDETAQKVGSRHFESSREISTEHEKRVVAEMLTNSASDSLIPHPESDQRMQKLAAQETLSQTLNLSAVPARLLKSVSHHLTKHIGYELDQIGITDHNITELAQNVHNIFQKAPESIKKTYQDWANETEPATQKQAADTSIIDPEMCEHLRRCIQNGD